MSAIQGFQLSQGGDIERYDYNALDNKLELDTTLQISGQAADSATVGSKFGILTELPTLVKTNIVDAIKEIFNKIGNLTNLQTSEKNTIVDAINQLDDKKGDLSTLQTNEKQNLVSAINELTYINYTEDDYPYYTFEGREGNAGAHSFASGYRATASGTYSHAEGIACKATGSESYSQGSNNTASGQSAHAEGTGNTASGFAAHAEGGVTKATGQRSHAEGYSTQASGDISHTQNCGTIAQGYAQTAIGKYNIAQGTKSSSSDSDFAFIIGNGSSNSNRSNAFGIDWQGNAYSYPTTLNLGNYITSGILTSNGSRMMFSIPLGRLLPSTANISSISFSICARVGNSEGAGIYCIRGAQGTNTVPFSSSTDSIFYNADGNSCTLWYEDSVTTWGASIQGGTSILINWDYTEQQNYFFSGSQTTNSHINNNPVTIFLSNIVINLTYNGN